MWFFPRSKMGKSGSTELKNFCELRLTLFLRNQLDALTLAVKMKEKEDN